MISPLESWFSVEGMKTAQPLSILVVWGSGRKITLLPLAARGLWLVTALNGWRILILKEITALTGLHTVNTRKSCPQEGLEDLRRQSPLNKRSLSMMLAEARRKKNMTRWTDLNFFQLERLVSCNPHESYYNKIALIHRIGVILLIGLDFLVYLK